MAKHGFYELIPGKLGCEVKGVDLQRDPEPEVIKQLIADVHRHRLLVFRNQGNVTGDRHVEISEWFGELESTFYKHPKSPHPDVFRVSNDKYEGCTNVGRTGWHNDGVFMREPFAYSLYHIDVAPTQGSTAFIPLTELIEQLEEEKFQRWNRIWIVMDPAQSVIHPLIYPHPVTDKQTMCFHLGMIHSIIWDYDNKQKSRMANPEETEQTLKEIHHEIVKSEQSLQYSHQWVCGDFIVSDNLAVGHEATPETQFPVSEVGLRVLHRTTIKGNTRPKK